VNREGIVVVELDVAVLVSGAVPHARAMKAVAGRRIERRLGRVRTGGSRPADDPAIAVEVAPFTGRLVQVKPPEL